MKLVDHDVGNDRPLFLIAGPCVLEEGSLARDIAGNPPLTVQGVKQVMNHDARSVGDGLSRVALWNAAFLPSRDLGEAMRAFQEKRPPEFTGE